MDYMKSTSYSNEITTKKYNTYSYTSPYALDEVMTSTQSYDNYAKLDNTKPISYGSRSQSTEYPSQMFTTPYMTNDIKTTFPYSKYTRPDRNLKSIAYEVNTEENKTLDFSSKYVEASYVPKSITYSTIKSKTMPEILYLLTTPYRTQHPKVKSTEYTYYNPTTVDYIKNIDTDKSSLGFKTFDNTIFTSNENFKDTLYPIEDKDNHKYTYEKESSNNYEKSGNSYNAKSEPDDYLIENQEDYSY